MKKPIKPREPVGPPAAPQEFFVVKNNISFDDLEYKTLLQILEWANNNGLPYDTLVFESDYNCGTILKGPLVDTKQKNTHYEYYKKEYQRNLKRYEKLKAKYDKDLAVYEKEIIKYQKYLSEKSLADALDVIKKHGLKVINPKAESEKSQLELAGH